MKKYFIFITFLFFSCSDITFIDQKENQDIDQNYTPDLNINYSLDWEFMDSFDPIVSCDAEQCKLPIQTSCFNCHSQL